MKSLLKNFSVFILLTIFISAFAACGNKSNVAQNGVNDKLPANNASADNTPKNADASEYPSAPAGIMKADLKMINNASFKLEEQKGNVILFNMWATWCGPCRSEMPELIELQDKYRDKNFKIIGLDADNEDEAQIKDFAGKMKLNYDLGWITEDQMTEFLKISKFSGIPQSFLIDRDGHLRGVFTGGGPSVIGKLKETVSKVISE